MNKSTVARKNVIVSYCVTFLETEFSYGSLHFVKMNTISRNDDLKCLFLTLFHTLRVCMFSRIWCVIAYCRLLHILTY